MRIVGSLTSIPERVNKTIPILQALLNEPLDVIYFNIPFKTSSGKLYKLNTKMLEFIKANPRICLTRPKDLGPITKLYPVLDEEKDPNTLIVTFDDDNLIKKGLINFLLKGLKRHPTAAIGISGICIGNFPWYYQRTKYVDQDIQVDWLEGVCTCLYQRSFFGEDFLLFKNKNKHYEKNDDHWISAYLSLKKIKKWSLGHWYKFIRETRLKKIKPLSGRHVYLFSEHLELMRLGQRKGWYHLNGLRFYSIGCITIIIIILLALIFFVL